MELEELRQVREIDIQHLLAVDDYFTWWVKGRSYLCRIIDLLHMGYVDEVLFGKEVLDRLPTIIEQWATLARQTSAPTAVKPLSNDQRKALAKTRATVQEWVKLAVEHPERFAVESDEQRAQEAEDQAEETDEAGEL
jgi:hypothetical protein